jgi:hypothetical protein
MNNFLKHKSKRVILLFKVISWLPFVLLIPYVIWSWLNSSYQFLHNTPATLPSLMILERVKSISSLEPSYLLASSTWNIFSFSVSGSFHPLGLRLKVISLEVLSLKAVCIKNTKSLSHLLLHTTQHKWYGIILLAQFFISVFIFTYWNVRPKVGNLFIFSSLNPQTKTWVYLIVKSLKKYLLNVHIN